MNSVAATSKAEKKVRLRIVTPTETKFDEDVDMIIMRCMNGDMGIMYGHDARSAALDYGIMRILDNGGERRLAVLGGIAEIKDNLLTVLTNDAEWPEDIDRAQAEADREHAERSLETQAGDIEIQRSQILLRRSLVQIEVSSYPFVNKPAENADKGENKDAGESKE